MILKRILMAAGAFVVVAVLAVVGIWYFVIRSTPPPPVSIDAAVNAAGQTAATDQSTASTSTGSLFGSWSITPDGSSFVGYRVRENLVGIGANTAVGRTAGVQGTLVFDGKQITEVKITADLTRLRSDDRGRDGHLRFDGLDYGRFPTATFVLTSPIPIDGVPAEGVTIDKTAQGNLALLCGPET